MLGDQLDVATRVVDLGAGVSLDKFNLKMSQITER